ncbi:flagellar assembly peptidoglycan hydrolase FlgJ [Marinomonas sp. M1K-6]|uniref:Peptidoglycan hydrolase FlgJ n=1 Tax=Marinomonas profundi TaxID=2726122 RepID=A0A847R4U2_9GAMM|nr:flagellar assembly peptidoglycan hydrolase FlgJ [Marinomonas profundi]NLQ17523.1 flagellar assembly peptidoglycan hydrolase FlgJ [Marinomonas profundi]UDV02259.1 flagellar assembly peptidoglycan hydrolase FlgJ [Marinomonas profundi]
MNSVPPKEDFFADFSTLTALKTKAQKDPDGALKDVAQQFESIFINMLLKNMRSTNEAIGGGLFSSAQTKQYQEMMDSQMSQGLAKSGGIGLSEALVRQYQTQQQGGLRSSAAKERGDTDFLNQVAKQDLVRIQALAHRASTDFIQSVQQEAEQKTAAVSGGDAVSAPSALSVVFESPEAFVEHLWPHAQKAAQTLGVNPKAVLAQAALETGWGKYPIAKEDGAASFNVFGIKADSRWQGDRAVVNTLEFRDGVAKREKAAFRAYDSFSQSFDDYANFLSSSERYKDALQAGDDASMFAASLQQGGYATDPKYAEKIDNILSSQWFQRL